MDRGMSLLICRIVIIKFKVQISKFKVMTMFKTIDFRALTAILLFLLALLFRPAQPGNSHRADDDYFSHTGGSQKAG